MTPVTREEQTPKALFMNELVKAGYTEQQATVLMEFLNDIRSGPARTAAEREERIRTFESLPRKHQDDLIGMIGVWNWDASSKKKISDLTASEMKSITGHLKGPFAMLPSPVFPEGTPARERYFPHDKIPLPYTSIPLVRFGPFPGPFQIYKVGGSGVMHNLSVQVHGDAEFNKYMGDMRASDKMAFDRALKLIEVLAQLETYVALAEKEAMKTMRRSTVPKRISK